MKRVTRAHRLALTGVLLLGVILVPQVGMGLDTIGAIATVTVTPTPTMGTPHVTAPPTTTTAPQKVTTIPTAVVSAAPTTVAPPGAATSTPKAEATLAATGTPTLTIGMTSLTATPTETTASQQATLPPTAVNSPAHPTVAATKTPSPAVFATENPRPHVTETPTRSPTSTPTEAGGGEAPSSCQDDESCNAAEAKPVCTDVPAPDTKELLGALLITALTVPLEDLSGYSYSCNDRNLLANTRPFSIELSKALFDFNTEVANDSSPDIKREERSGDILHVTLSQEKNTPLSNFISIAIKFTFHCRGGPKWVLAEISAAVRESRTTAELNTNNSVTFSVSTNTPNAPEKTSCPIFSRNVIGQAIRLNNANLIQQEASASEETLTEMLNEGSIGSELNHTRSEWGVTGDGYKVSNTTTISNSAQTKLNTSIQCDGAIFSALFDLNEILSKSWPDFGALELPQIRWPMIENSTLASIKRGKRREQAKEDLFFNSQELTRSTMAISTPTDDSSKRSCTRRHERMFQTYYTGIELAPSVKYSEVQQERGTHTLRATDLSEVLEAKIALLSLAMGLNKKGPRFITKILRAKLDKTDIILSTLVNLNDVDFKNPSVWPSKLDDKEQEGLAAYGNVITELDKDEFFSKYPTRPDNPYDGAWFVWRNWDWGRPFPPDVPSE